MRFLNDASEAENHLEGSLFNEYALGSRVQYHVSAGGMMFVVEKLREQAYRGAPNDDVMIGWDACVAPNPPGQRARGRLMANRAR